MTQMAIYITKHLFNKVNEGVKYIMNNNTEIGW